MMIISDKDHSGKQPIWMFLLLVTIFAGLSYLVAFKMGDKNRAGGIFLVQFSPMLAAFITRLIYRQNLRGFGWGWGKTRYQLAAYITPFGLALVSFSLIWVLGFGGLSTGPMVAEAQVGLEQTFGLKLNRTSVTLLVLLLVNSTFGLFIAFGAVGEELGWRGFLVPELYKHYSYTKTSFISGTIWAVYHFPLLIVLMAPRLEVSAWPLLVATLIGGIGLTFIMNWYRIKSGSVWTAVIFHAALNIYNQGFFQNMTVKTSWLTHYVSGEHGFMLAIVSAAAAYLFWRGRDSLPASAN
jgi:membrane protease YdiL (CAAX protease family)